jgi:hypothetical protein
MRPQRRRVSLWFQPGRAEVRHQPLGAVGIIVPWNYPLYLAVGRWRRRWRPATACWSRCRSSPRRPASCLPSWSAATLPPMRWRWCRATPVGGALLRNCPSTTCCLPARRRSATRHARGGREPDAGDARTRRQVAGDHRRRTTRWPRRRSASSSASCSTPGRPASRPTTCWCRPAASRLSSRRRAPWWRAAIPDMATPGLHGHRQ